MRSPARRAKHQNNRLGRALTALIIGIGIGAIALSFVPSPQPRVPNPPLQQTAGADLSQSVLQANAVRASDLLRSGSGGALASEGHPVAQPTPRPIIRAAAPTGAPSAIGNVRGITTGSVSDQAASAPPPPFSVVVAVQDAQALGALAAAVTDGLIGLGVNATVAPLSEAGRPDAILVLNGVQDSRNETWFCDPGPAQGVVLATELLSAVGPGEGFSNIAEPRSSFPCQDIHAGRARVPAVLLELANGGAGADSAVIAQALKAYFDGHRGPVLAARATPRMIWPALGPVTSHYSISHPLGIDIGQWEGPVVAATDGVVTFAGGDPCCSYGLFVLVESSDGLATLYGHFENLSVSNGQQVRQGQVLGEVGCTGTCFGTHLHFEVWQDGIRQDPMKYLD